MNITFISADYETLQPYGEQISEAHRTIFDRPQSIDFINLIGKNYAIIALFDNQIVGMAMVKEKENNFLLCNFGVLPTYRRQQIGTKIFQEVINYCHGNFHWEVFADDISARLFYLQVGGRIVSEDDDLITMVYDNGTQPVKR